MQHMVITIIVIDMIDHTIENKYDVEFWTIPDKSQSVPYWNNAGVSDVHIVYSLGVDYNDDITPRRR